MHCAEVGNQNFSPFSVDLLHTLGESGLELPSGIFVFGFNKLDYYLV